MVWHLMSAVHVNRIRSHHRKRKKMFSTRMVVPAIRALLSVSFARFGVVVCVFFLFRSGLVWCWRFCHHFICQDNFSRYSFFKFNFDFRITYLFRTWWHIERKRTNERTSSPSVSCEKEKHIKPKKKVEKISHVEITRPFDLNTA